MSVASLTVDPGRHRRITAPLRWLRRRSGGMTLILITAVFMAPFFWVLSHSLESTTEWERSGVTLWPGHTTFANYTEIIKLGFLRNVLASIVVASITTIITLVFASLAGYAIARLPIRGRGLILGFVILAGFFPVMAMMGPMYLMLRNLGLLNTWWGVSIADTDLHAAAMHLAVGQFVCATTRGDRGGRDGRRVQPPRCLVASGRAGGGSGNGHRRDLFVHPRLERLHILALVPRDAESVHRYAGDSVLWYIEVPDRLQPD